MGSGGGGSAGKVDYSEYIKTIHHSLLNQVDADTLNMSAVGLMQDAYDSSPYATATTYTGRAEIGALSLNTAQIIAELLTMDHEPYEKFRDTLPQIASDVQALFDLTQLQIAISKESEKADPEYNKMLQTYDALELSKGTAFSSTRILGRTQVLDAKMRAVMSESLDALSKSILQLGANKLGDALAVADQQMENFRVGKTAYTMAVEMCKLQILNEREYFEQTEFYVKYGAHWRFESMQAVFNDLGGMYMGKRLTFISNDMPKWLQDITLVNQMYDADPMAAVVFKGDKQKYRATLMGAASGAMSGMQFGPYGIAAGAAIGGAVSYFTYTPGEWR